MNPKLPTKTVIYTDGGVSPNPGPGGWAAVILHETKGQRTEQEISGTEKYTTNNRMEIVAMLRGLQALKKASEVTIYTDSKYLKGSIGNWENGNPVIPFGWIKGWESRNWFRREGPIKNIDLWKELLVECKKQKSINMRWIRGHTGDHYNERCDVLATEARIIAANYDPPPPSECIAQNNLRAT